MQLQAKLFAGLSVMLLVVLLAVVITGFVRTSSLSNTIGKLQNELAMSDKTIETQKNQYEKLVIFTDDLGAMIGEQDSQLSSLLEQLKARDQEVLSANALVVKWKKAYEAEANAKQEDVPPIDGAPQRTKVTFEKDFGYIGVDGYTITNPAYAYVRIKQNRPLSLYVLMSQSSDKAWHITTVSSEDNVGVDIKLAAINPYILKSKWYESIGVSMSLAGGQSSSGLGALAGLGVSYEFGKFEVGPSVWVTSNLDRFFGVNAIWHPFKRQ